jgi:hypothetical protein
MLVARGYELSGLPVRAPSAVGLAWLRVHDTLARWRFRTRIHGVRLFLAEVLTRRLGIDTWAKPLQRRIEEIDARRVK